jgi:outer membrane receptor protein involved in Fe transport
MRATSNFLPIAVSIALLGSASFSYAQGQLKTDSKGVLEEVIVTASKVESSIQDTPIAVSAFTQDQLDSQLINDTMNLQFSVPNMTMSKQNFTANDIRIRGIGSGAIGPAGDSGVGIHINGAYQTSSRIFEAQFYDTERVEVLRGPQGTLYGRNTTGGVVNVITGKANPDEFAAQIDGTVGNYSFRQMRGMVNVPLGDNFALRVAGMGLNRDGFIDNVYDGEDVDNRDMWAGRLSLTWNVSDDTEINFMYSTFEEDDNRVRSQKQACVYDPAAVLGCLPGKPKYENANSAAGITGALMASISGLNAIAQGYLGGFGQATGQGNYAALGLNALTGAAFFPAEDYVGDTNPDGVRQVNMDTKPLYYTEEEVFQLQVSHDFGDLQLYYNGGYSTSEVMSIEDYEKGVSNSDWTPALNSLAQLGSVPALPASMMTDIIGALAPAYGAGTAQTVGLLITNAATGIPGVGLWAGNPALAGLSNGVQVLDLPEGSGYSSWFRNGGWDESSNRNKQWTHELRLQSSFDGPLNFLLGGFYLDFDNTNAYIVRSAGLALPGQILPIDTRVFPAPIGDPNNPRSETDPYMQGYHNDSRSYKLNAAAVFGEVYWDVTDALRLTFGGRFSEEEKTGKQRTIYVTFSDLPPIQPNNAFFTPEWEQEEFTWKFNATWSMSDETMMYATASSSFKSGGFNPISDNSPLLTPAFGGSPANAFFEPEFVDAYEIGLKTTLLDGALRVNASGFYYDYADFQQSQIVNVTSKNVNSDAEIMGLELDVIFAVTPNLIATFSGGYLDTEIGEFWSVDTANPNATSQADLARDPTLATAGVVSVNGVNFIPGADATGQRDRCETAAPNPCYGFMQNQQGNQIAGSPELNFNIGLAYTLPLGSMDVTLSTNYYWQDEFYASNFNNISNLVDDWSMWNASARVAGEQWYAEAWIKNIEDNDNVTGHYLTSSVSALFTNQFILDPQTYGISVGYKW